MSSLENSEETDEASVLIEALCKSSNCELDAADLLDESDDLRTSRLGIVMDG